MKIIKIILITILIVMTTYFSINTSTGAIGGPGQNGCYHNHEFYAVAPNATTCPDPGGHEETVFSPHYTVNDPECLIEIIPLH